MYKNIENLNKESVRLNLLSYRSNKLRNKEVNKMLNTQRYKPILVYIGLETY